MSHLLQTQTQPPAHGAQPGFHAAAATFECLVARQFMSMERSYRRHGGWVSGDELADRLRCWSGQPVSIVARWIVSRSIICIAWKGQTLIPVFQFEWLDMSVRPEVVQIIEELNGVLDDWELALWFAQPNVWLNEESPLDLMREGAPAVLQAARADGFIVRG